MFNLHESVSLEIMSAGYVDSSYIFQEIHGNEELRLY